MWATYSCSWIAEESMVIEAIFKGGTEKVTVADSLRFAEVIDWRSLSAARYFDARPVMKIVL